MPKWQRWKGIMKMYPFEEKRLAKWEPPYIVQPKYEGWRCRAVPIQTQITGTYILLSSEGNIFYSVPHLTNAFDILGLKAEFDGELYCHGMTIEQISSIAGSNVNLHPNHEELEFHVFDIKVPEPQMRRLVLIDSLKGMHPKIKVSPFWLCETLDEVKEIYDKVILMRYEGIIVRHFQGPYEEKRSTFAMKFKPKKKDTYQIIGWKEEVSMDGVPKGRIGSVLMSSQAGDEFSASAGLDFDEKARLWKIRDKLDTMKAIVHYQHMTNKKIPKGTFNIEVLEGGD